MKQNLDYMNPKQAVNFRDVGVFINLIVAENKIPGAFGEIIIPEKRLFRGGTIKAIYEPAVIGNPKTIFCLQKGPDHPLSGVCNVHFPISNDYEKYNTYLPEVQRWLKAIFKTIEEGLEFPLYIHCLSGRDRTGVLVAAILKTCGVADDAIIEEYHLSIGTESADYHNKIRTALEGFQDLNHYFKGIDLARVKSILKGQVAG
jgi:protein-tyrosine phosphatase